MNSLGVFLSPKSNRSSRISESSPFLIKSANDKKFNSNAADYKRNNGVSILIVFLYLLTLLAKNFSRKMEPNFLALLAKAPGTINFKRNFNA